MVLPMIVKCTAGYRTGRIVWCRESAGTGALLEAWAQAAASHVNRQAVAPRWGEGAHSCERSKGCRDEKMIPCL